MVYPNLKLSSGWFTGTVPVRDLQMNIIQIITIESNAFEADSFASLSYLYITCFNLVFRIDTFNGLHSLEILRINGLKLQCFQCLNGVGSTLKELQIWSSEFNVANGFTSDIEMMNLVYIDISSKLQSLNKQRIFERLSRLMVLDLSDCGISSLDTSTFTGISTTLEVLNLDNNQLKTLPLNVFDQLISLTVLRLNNNPWHCNSELCPLQRYITKYSANNLNVICFSPAEMKLKPVSGITNICPIDNTTQTIKCLDSYSFSLMRPAVALQITTFSDYIVISLNGTTVNNFDDYHVTIDTIDAVSNEKVEWVNNFNGTEDTKIFLKNLTAQCVSMVCVMPINPEISTPNCLSFFRMPIITIIWLPMHFKVECIIFMVLIMFLCFAFGLVLGYTILWMFPTWLKGSKKVTVVLSRSSSATSATVFESNIFDWTDPDAYE